jgi:hypothetical protein
MSRKRNLDSRSLDTSLPFTRDNANRNPWAQGQRGRATGRRTKEIVGKQRVRRAFLYTHSGITLFPAHLPESRRVWDRVRDRVKQLSGGYRRRLVAKRCWNFRDLEFDEISILLRVWNEFDETSFFRGCAYDFDKTSSFFWVCGRVRTVRSTGDGNSKGNYETTVGGNDGTNWWATRKGRKGRRKIRVGFTHGRASCRSVRCNGFFHRPERTGTHPSTMKDGW